MLKRSMFAALALCAACTQAQPPAAPQAPAAGAVSLDPRLYGQWRLDVARSEFDGPGPAPTAGVVYWTARGWVFALAFGEALYTDAVVDNNGCTLVGAPDSYSCESQIVTPTHVHFIERNSGRITRESDIELIDANTYRASHRMTPSVSAPYAQVEYWTRAQP